MLLAGHGKVDNLWLQRDYWEEKIFTLEISLKVVGNFLVHYSIH